MKQANGSPFRPGDLVHDPRRIDDVLELMPEDFRLKGMFIAPLAERLGRARVEALKPSMKEPPREGYLPFHGYPQPDHGRILSALVDLEHPDVSHAEGVRRIAREDMTSFAGSTFGKVILAMIGDTMGALAQLPRLYGQLAPGTAVTAERVGDAMRLDYVPLFGLYAYQLGQVEGIAAHYGEATRIEVYEDTAVNHIRLVVHVER